MTVQMPKGLADLSNYKRTRAFELAIPLNTNCNMRCEFCFENHKENVTFDASDFPKILDTVVSYMKKELSVNNYDIIDLKLWGGELLYDEVPDWMFDEYRKFVLSLKEQLPLPFTVIFLTNGVFTKRDRVMQLMKEVNGNLSVSYDPVGRFTSEKQRNIFLETLTYAKKYIHSISNVLTKPTIDAYVAGDNFLLELDKKIFVVVNFYIANRMWRKYMPSGEDYYRFLKWCLDNRLFNVDWLYNIMVHTCSEQKDFVRRVCNCKEAVQYIPGEFRCSPDCIKDRICNVQLNDYYGKYTEGVTEENQYEVRTTLMMQKSGCLLCEHFRNCTMMCSASTLFKEFDLSTCPVRKMYDTITEEDKAVFRKFQQTVNTYKRGKSNEGI